VLRRQKNARVLLAEAVRIDTAAHQVVLREAPPLAYDFLVVATGAITSYFGHEEWRDVAPGLKDIEDAVEIRRRVLLAFEAAEREPDPDGRRRHLTFVVIGGGPTGVELAGAIAELASYVLARDFRAINPESTRVVLLEGGPRILNSFAAQLSDRALRSLVGMGVEVRTSAQVTKIDEDGVLLGSERIRAGTVLWAAGVAAAPLPKELTARVDRTGRAQVERDCSLPGHPEIFCIGDAAAFLPEIGKQPLPGVSGDAARALRCPADWTPSQRSPARNLRLP
jgi:NADH dehydrogenase